MHRLANLTSVITVSNKCKFNKMFMLLALTYFQVIRVAVKLNGIGTDHENNIASVALL